MVYVLVEVVSLFLMMFPTDDIWVVLLQVINLVLTVKEYERRE